MNSASSIMQPYYLALRFLPHALALIVATSAFAGAAQPFALVGSFFLVAPFAETLLGESRGERHHVEWPERVATELLPWLWLPLQLALLVAGLYVIVRTPDLFSVWSVALAAGMLSGMFGMAMAHDLMHRRERAARVAAWLQLCAFGYGHFFVEHVYGHHRHAGTAADAATARLGESLYAFLPRSVFGGLRSAWRLEADRLRRNDVLPFGPQNRVLISIAVWLLMCGVVAQIAGARGLLFFVAQGAVGVAILEVMNYVQHYGLQVGRARNSQTWDCGFRLTNLLLCNLGRHADHHVRPVCKARRLENRRDAPHLPAGYFSMFIVALLPPLWSQIMDPRVLLVRERLALGLAPLPDRYSHEGEIA